MQPLAWVLIAFAAACSSSEPPKLRPDGSAGGSGMDGAGNRVDAPFDAPGGSNQNDAPSANGGDAAGGMIGNPTPGLVEGVACRMGSECRSGFCVDGVCCDLACTGTCLSCAVQGSVGSCVPADVGTDPRDQCADEGLASCGRDGVCDGAGACRKYPSGAVCKAAACSGSTMTLVARCDGNGTCTPAATQTCAPFTCEGTAGCRSSCTTNADCTAPNTCVNGSCGKKPLGVSCSVAGECNSAFCEQGVCCAAACNGVCQSCALPGTAGTCTTVAAGADPLGQCADSGATSCGRDGACDGAGKCRMYASGTICSAATCTGTTESGTRRCNGTGTCGMAPTRSCSPFRCGTGGTCPTTCTTAAQCVTDYSCIGGICKKKTGGTACTAAAECAAGFCAQGVCCDKACGAPCVACNLGAALLGICSPVPAGQDPMNQCDATPVAGCGNNGSCDGLGACQNFASGTVCKAVECTGVTQTLASRCNGTGMCVVGGTQTCAPFLCGTGGACKSTCAMNSDCSTGNVCTGTSCGKKPAGSPCTAASECGSGFCAQGVCCGSACTETCKSCALTGSEGTCLFVPGGDDPLMQCADDGSGSCNKDGTCDGAGKCHQYSAGTVCAPPMCAGATATPERTCNGSGTCQTAMTSSCGNYACDTNGMCRQTCTSDAHCSGLNVCNTGVCSKKLLGVTCADPNECQSGFCQQNVCCDSSCTGNCRSCALAATKGTCKFVSAGEDPLSHCPADATDTCDRNGFCDGNGGCQLYATGSPCGAASCTNNTGTPVPQCNGTGNCVAAQPVACNPFVCGPTACRTTCTTSADCQSPNICNIVNGVGSCGGKSNGGTCMTDPECASGTCAQGRCCATACAGGCLSCGLTGKEGTCSVVPAGDDPLGFCTDGGFAACGNDGFCNGSGACRIYAAGTSCAPAACSNATFTPERTCTGTGTGACQTVTNQSCGKYTCNGAACRTNCGSTADCTGTSVCNNTFCGGLKGEYFGSNNFTNLKLTRTDATVDFDFGVGSPDPSIPTENFSIRWTGMVTPFTTQTYTFVTYSDDTVVLTVNGQVIISNLTPHQLTRNTGNIALTANQSVSIKLEMTENTGQAVIRLFWQGPSFPQEVVIPARQLIPAP